MTGAAFVIALVRTALVVVPAIVAAHAVRTRLSSSTGALAAAVELVVALSWLLVVGELLGLVGALRLGWVIAATWASAAAAFGVLRMTPAARSSTPAGAATRQSPRLAAGSWAAVGVIWLAAGQWVLSTANALGGGMLSFDVLWYHMPFAAVFAQSGSVTGITFTQADPFVAYYPANSELVHALGIVAFGNDFPSVFINLGWMAVELLGAWCVGRRWRIEWLTLAAGALLLALPVLGTTQPGEAFNDIVGLAALTVAVAVMLAPERGRLELWATGLALGLAVGTKYTFLVPAGALVIGAVAALPRGQRRSAAVPLLVGLVATGGWWYLRALVRTGNPLGLAQSIGPVHLPGPRSPLANASQQTVFSEIRHLSLWTSRFAPGLAHAFGPLWPLLLLGCVAAVVVAAVVVAVGRGTPREPLVRVIAIAAVLAGVSYLFLPTGATGLRQNSTTFQVNLRYLAPALELALLLAPIVVVTRLPRLVSPLAVLIAAIALTAQLERGMWRAQPARHVVFLASIAVIAAIAVWARSHATVPRGMARAAGAVALVGLVVVAGDVAQRHYFRERYRVGATKDPGIELIYRWAQGVTHSRIALYGTVEQYPLYGATDTNAVDYLGQPAPHGGYQPIASCARWQATIAADHARYLVLTPAPTAAIPLAWSEHDPDLTLLMHPSPGDWVYRVQPSTTGASRCPAVAA